MQAFCKDANPLDPVAYVIFFDATASLSVHATVRYLVPAQLEALLLNMRFYNLTCIIQKIFSVLPGISAKRRSNLSTLSDSSYVESYTEASSERESQRGNSWVAEHEQEDSTNTDLSSGRTLDTENIKPPKYMNLHKEGMPPKVLRPGSGTSRYHVANQGIPVTARSSSLAHVSRPKYSILRVVWTPANIAIEGRQSEHAFSLHKLSPDERCSTFFSGVGYKMASAHRLTVQRINRALNQLAVHLSIQSESVIVDRMVVYIQVLDVAPSRKEIVSSQPVFLFAEDIIIGRRAVDGRFQETWRERVRRGYTRPEILSYEICRRVYTTLTTQFANHTIDDFCKDCYDKALKAGYGKDFSDVFGNLSKEDVLSLILKALTADIASPCRNDAYGFINKIAVEFATDIRAGTASRHESALDEDTTASITTRTDSHCYVDVDNNVNAGNSVNTIACNCVRCQKSMSAQSIPCKFLLSEPLFYLSQKFPILQRLYSAVPIADLYRILHYILTGQKEYIKGRDTILVGMEKLGLFQKRLRANSLKSGPDADETASVSSRGLGSYRQPHANDNDGIYAIISSTGKGKEDTLLPFDKLQELFEMNSITVVSCVPVRLLRRCNLPEYTVSTFLRRLDDKNFTYKTCFVCNTCSEELVRIMRALEAAVK